MPVKCICHPDTGKHLYFGRKKSIAPIPHLRLANYLDKSALPIPPATCSYNEHAANVISQMYGNDRLGDCVIAGMAHLIGTFTSIFGKPALFTLPQIIAMYSRIGGYVPGDPSTDQGCDILTALNYWQRRGFVTIKHKILGFAAVNAYDPQEYRTALYMFCHLMKGIDLPDAWINPFPNDGDTWDIAGPPDPNNGHFIVTCEYDEHGTVDDTWGMKIKMTDSAIEAYCSIDNGGELYVALGEETINHATGKAPGGFNVNQLKQDLGLFGGYPNV
jgi:hypothetical protein